MEYKRANKGGEQSDVNGGWYVGGQWMPITGKGVREHRPEPQWVKDNEARELSIKEWHSARLSLFADLLAQMECQLLNQWGKPMGPVNKFFDDLAQTLRESGRLSEKQASKVCDKFADDNWDDLFDALVEKFQGVI